MESQSTYRKLARVGTPSAEPGFLGADHTARAVVYNDLDNSDPFILLMDDFLDKKDNKPVGGPHPHAGFETVSFLLEGEIGDEGHMMKAGDFQIMTAGSGIVHTESIEKKSRMRLLQMWLNLPKNDRWAAPRVQDLSAESAPVAAAPGSVVRVYSGSFAGVTSPIQNHVPLIVADIRLEPGVTTAYALDFSLNAFIYVIDGSVSVGEDSARQLNENQVGWLEKTDEETTNQLQITAGNAGARLVLYAAQPQHDEIVSYGPFIADTQEDIRNLYSDFRRGKMNHVSELPQNQRFAY